MPKYLYFNIYTHLPSNTKRYYVGIHSWEGPSGELDPSYHGTSCIIHPSEIGSNWKSYSSGHKSRLLERALEYRLDAEYYLCPATDLRDESLMIDFFCTLYGCSDESSNEWSLRYRKGLMLNRHNLKSTPSSHQKGVETRKRLGSYFGCPSSAAARQSRQTAITRNNCNWLSEASCRKRVCTMQENGSWEKFQKSSQTKEAIAKSVQTRAENGSTTRWVKAVKSPEARERNHQSLLAWSKRVQEDKNRRRLSVKDIPRCARNKIKVMKGNTELCRGYVSLCLKYLALDGLVTTSSTVRRYLKQGLDYKGYRFFYL